MIIVGDWLIGSHYPKELTNVTGGAVPEMSTPS